MLLVLKRDPEQEAALVRLLEAQQIKSLPQYHEWLTPEQFGKQFGLADSAVQTVTSWLAANGFNVEQVSKGRMVIEFSGTAGQVQQAFHTSIHKFTINGRNYWANASDPQVPVALADSVAGVASLNSFPRRSHARFSRSFRRNPENAGPEPLYTFPNPFTPGTFYGLGPGDFAVIYNSKPLIAAGNDGTGQVIAVVGESNLKVQDVQQFRSMFNLPANFDSSSVILNGEDPGIVSTDEEGEVDLDVQWSGAVAPGATIKSVVSASTATTPGVDLSALYIVDQNLAGVMSESFGTCENALGSAGNSFFKSLWEQAAAQGITVVLSSGDGGSAGCDDFNTQQVATQGLAVSGLASTPFNVSVGGTDFDQVNNWGSYWNSTNDSTGTSAKTYIPEIPWSENCAQIGLSGCTNAPVGSVNIVAGGGGPSSIYPKPKWQMGVPGMPNDNLRDQPDVSLFASPGFDGSGYIYCQSDVNLSGVRNTCDLNSNIAGPDFGIVGGTSASAPAFAGIMALVNQYQAAHGGTSRQGNPNYVLYALAKQAGAMCVSGPAESAACIFNDVTKGNQALPTGAPGVGTNSVPCRGGSPNCSLAGPSTTGVLVDPASASTEAWTAAQGYDMATGLGSVNANNLAINWGRVLTTSTTTTLMLSPTTGLSHGGNENVSVNIAVKANTGPGVPTGDVSLLAQFSDGSQRGLAQFSLTGGAISGAMTQSLPGGSYNVVAHYAGDGPNAPSDSNPVPVSVSPEGSKVFVNLVTIDLNGNPTSFTAGNATYGSGFYLLRVDVGDSAATVSPSTGISSNCSKRITNCPTGNVAFTANAAPLAGLGLALNSAGYAEDFSVPPGTYAVTANYAGDSSYAPAMTSVNLTIAKAPTTASAAVAGLPVQYGNNEQIAADIVTTSNGIAPTGTFSFFLDGSPLNTTPLAYEGFPYEPGSSPPFYATLSGSGLATFLSIGNHVLSTQYSGDANYAPSASQPSMFTVTQAQPSFGSYGASPGSVMVNQPVTLQANLQGSNAGVAPTGTITFFDNGTQLSGTVTYTSVPPTRLTVSALMASMPYTPTTIGMHGITVKYSGDLNYLPSTTSSAATLTVTGPDFSLTSTGTTVQTISAGQTATFPNAVTLSALNGFNAQVDLSCTLTAAMTTCAVNPPSLPSGNGSATVTVTTTARSLSPPFHPGNRFFFRPSIAPSLVFIWLFAHFLLRIVCAPRRYHRRLLFLVVAIPLLILAVASCGSSSSSSSPPPPRSGTPPGMYIITVTGTSGSMTHTTVLSLNVN